MAKGDLPWFDFLEVPPLMLRVRYRKTFVTLIAVEEYTTKDGRPSKLLVWRTDDGRIGRSGLHSNDLTFVKAKEAAHG